MLAASMARRVPLVLMLSGALVAGSIAPAAARGGGARGGGGAARGGGGGQHMGSFRGGGGQAMPQSRPTTSARTNNVNSGNRTTNVANGNRANVNVGSRDVNVQGNTAVRPATRAYGRAPYAHGGHRYYAHHAYAHHAYRGFGWGAGFRPLGAVVATVAATALVVNIANQNYRYSVVTAPIGATGAAVPASAVTAGPSTLYYGGTYYEKTGTSYKVVAPVAGTVVEHLPEGGEEVTVGSQKYVKLGETYYQPIKKDGKDMYEVVKVE
jgi:hypothetical protein